MHRFLCLLPGKLRAKAVLSFIYLAGLAFAANAAFLSTTTQAQTFKAIPLDGGGWTSGFAQAQGRIYAYGDAFGAWRTDNKGVNWTYLNWSIPDGDLAGYGMAAQQDNADIVYYLTSNSLYKSINGGTSWNKLLSDIHWGAQQPKEYQRVRGATHILIHSGNADELWLASPRSGQTGTLWKKSSNTTQWTKMGDSTFNVSTNRALTVYQSAIYPSHIWVGAEKGLYVTNDGGTNFRKVTSDINVGMIRQFNTGTYAGVLLTNRGPFCCSNNGVTRITSNGNYSDITTYQGSIPTQVNMGYPTGLQVFSDNTAVAWNTAGDVQGYSIDGGQTFVKRATTLDHTKNVPIWTTAATMDAKDHPDYGTDQVIEVAGSNGSHWIITGGGAAMESTNSGVTWSYFPNGSGIAGVKTYPAGVSLHKADRMYIPGSDIGLVIVNDGGASGQAQRSSTKSQVYLHGAFRVMEGPDSNNLVIAGVHQQDNANLLLKSSNGGADWTPTSLSGSGLPLSWDGITKSVMSLNNTNDFLVSLASSANSSSAPASSINPGVWRTTTGGSSFFKVSDVTNGLPGNLNIGHRYGPQNSFLERDATLVNRRYFVSRHIGNSPTASTAFYRSNDGGTTWSSTANHPFGKGTWVWGLVADPVISANLWAAGSGGGVAYSTDGGDNWTNTASTNNYFDSKHVGACNGKIAVWGRKGGEPNPEFLWYSPDNGATWYQQTTAAKNFHGVQGLTVDRNGKIWVSWNSVTVVTPVTETKPAAPTALNTEGVTSSSFTLKWTASTSSGVTLYEVFKDGTSSGTTTTTSYNVTGLTAATTYSMTVKAKGNTLYSDASAALSVQTSDAAVTGTLFTGTVTGSPGYNNQSQYAVANAFDGNTNTFFAPDVNTNSLAQLDLGTTLTGKLTTLRFYPRPSFAGRMVNGVFQGSINGSNWTTLYTVSSTPTAGWNSVQMSDATFYRYFRYFQANNFADVSDIEFWGTTQSGTIGGITGNFGFENDFTGWSIYGTPDPSINSTTAHVHSGSKSGYFNGANGNASGANYELTGLTPNTTYSVKAWVKAVSGNDIWITAAAEGGIQTGQQMTSTTWTQSGNNIVFTTGNNVTKGRISTWVGVGSAAYFDDFTVESCSSCRVASAELESNQQAESLSLQLSPNPASREVSISLAGFEEEFVVQVQLRDMSGKSFLRRQVQPRVEGKQVSLSVGHLPHGLFFVTVQGSKVGKTAKLIITK